MKWNYLWIFFYCFVCEVQGQNNWHSNYNYIESFNEGVAIAKKNYKCAVVDFKGKEIIPLEYDEIKRIDGIFFKVRKNSRYGLFDKEGKLLIDVNYEDVGIFVDGQQQLSAMANMV